MSRTELHASPQEIKGISEWLYKWKRAVDELVTAKRQFMTTGSAYNLNRAQSAVDVAEEKLAEYKGLVDSGAKIEYKGQTLALPPPPEGWAKQLLKLGETGATDFLGPIVNPVATVKQIEAEVAKRFRTIFEGGNPSVSESTEAPQLQGAKETVKGVESVSGVLGNFLNLGLSKVLEVFIGLALLVVALIMFSKANLTGLIPK